jgi:hypothetical protein
MLVRLDQCHLDRSICPADVLGSSRARGSATNNNNPLLATGGSNGGEADGTDSSSATGNLDEILRLILFMILCLPYC